MKILIIEDEILVAEYIESILVNQGMDVIGIARYIKEALPFLDQKPDLCFVDIRLTEGDSGIDLGKELFSLGIPFVYLTANNELNTIRSAAKTFPEAYLSKPFNAHDIIAAIEIVKGKQEQKQTLSIKTVKGTVEILLQDILYIQADNIYSKIVTVDRKYLERTSLNNLMSRLNSNFTRIHRSFIVNKVKITSQKPNSMFVGEIEIPISKNRL